MTVFECDGIGTHWWFELHDAVVPPDIEQLVTTAIADFDQAYSRFKPNSYIGRLNRDKQLLQPPRELYEMFLFGKQMYEISGGAFDMSIGGALHAAGYGSRKNAGQIATDMWGKTVLSPEKIIIPASVIVDNGGFGKGWLIDNLGRLLQNHGVQEFIINGGGDILVHCKAPQKFGLEDSVHAGKLVGSTMITHGALAVSANNKRVWQHQGNTYSHIFDPHTGQPASSTVASVYVKAKTALIADTMATILLLRPELKDQLIRQFELQVILLPK